MRKDTGESNIKEKLISKLKEDPTVSVGLNEFGSTNIVYGEFENPQIGSGENTLVLTLWLNVKSQQWIPKIVGIFGDNSGGVVLNIRDWWSTPIIENYRFLSEGQYLNRDMSKEEIYEVLKLAKKGLEIIQLYNSLPDSTKEEIFMKYSNRIREERGEWASKSVLPINPSEVMLAAINSYLGEE